MERIEEIINSNNADIILINEFNIKNTQSLDLIRINDYTIEIDKLFKSKGQARSVMYIRKNLSYTRCHQYVEKMTQLLL